MKAIAALIAALKSILENEVNSQDIQKLHEALEMLKRGASADMKVFPVTSYDTLKAHIDGLAERAVSPAESVTARQAPDLSHLQRYVATPHDDRGMREEKLGAWVLLRDVQALLSSTAQPLQPADPQPTYAEWRKVVSLVHDAIKVVRTGPAITILMQCVDSLDAWSDQVAQPLQQEGGKDERAAFEEWHAERWGRPFRLGQTDQYKMDSSQGKWLAWKARAERGGCTCPSGDGSLRWPCPKHEQLPVAITDKAGPNGIKWYVSPDLPDGVNLYAEVK